MNFNNPYLVDQNGTKVVGEFRIKEQSNSTKLGFKIEKSKTIKEVVIFSGKHNLPSNTSIYGDGYQMLSQYSGTLKKVKKATFFTDKRHYKMPQTAGFATVYNYALIGSGDNVLLIGASSGHRFRTEIRVNKSEIAIVQCLENLEYEGNVWIELEDMVLLTGNQNEILNQFAQLININHPPKKFKEMPTGWCSWYCIGENISEADIFDNLKIIKEKTPELKYIQIDDGFQPFMGDWLDISDKFSRPMKDICNDIKKEGFEPAIWLAPFIASKKSKLFNEHPDYFIKDNDGFPLCSRDVTFGGWHDSPWYFLDCTNPDALKYIYDTVLEICKNWGVAYFKLDANVWGALPFGVRYQKNATSIEAYRKGMDALWRAVENDAFILGCNAPMWASLGTVTSMRVTDDVFRKDSSAAGLAKQCFRRNWMHNTLWVNDPDCLIMADSSATVVNPGGVSKKSNAKKKFYKFNNVYVRATGGLVLSGDFIEKYSKADIQLLKRILDTDYVPAEFNESLEVGIINRENKKEYFIFNYNKLLKKHTITVPNGYSAVDMYSNKSIAVQNGTISLLLKKYDCAWIELSKKE